MFAGREAALAPFLLKMLVGESTRVFLSTPLTMTLSPSAKPVPVITKLLPSLTTLVIVGPAGPVTVTVNEQVPRVLVASFAVQVTVVTPTGKELPDGGAQDTVTPGQPLGSAASG